MINMMINDDERDNDDDGVDGVMVLMDHYLTLKKF